MTIKKAYVELVEFLEANQNKKVSTIIEDIRSLCEAKTQGSASIKDGEGNIIAIYCWYHKQWEVVAEVPYGAKKSSATGLNTMCKVGTSLWTKQQREAKKANAEILTNVASGDIAPSAIIELQEDIEANRQRIDDTNMPQGFASEAEVLEYIASNN